MTEIEKELAQIKKEIDSAEARRSRALAEIDIRKEILGQAVERLKSEFGCESVEDANKQIEKTRAEIETLLTEVRKMLA